MSALTFPLTLEQFYLRQPVDELSFQLGEAVTTSGTGGGEILSAEHGPRLWYGSFAVWPETHALADQMVARVELLRGGIGSFLVCPKDRIGPQADPTGAVLGVAVPIISAIYGDGRRIGITGLPAGYQLTEGDLVSFTYGVAPQLYALHRVVTTQVATGGGGITEIELNPRILPGVVTGTALRLTRPQCKARLVPGSYTDQVQKGSHTDGYSVRWTQTLR